ncbi:unnamed protein product [Calicophoron daubneyi]|uniref:Oligomycin sensitivity conferral protein n=1 Tax=Calicophoron daubneyi TaxID=300641 RepID=A0AAV2SZ65_CALDB
MASSGFMKAIRCLNTSAPLRKLVHPPIQVFGVEGRYATALYSAASKSKVLDNVEKDLKLVRETLSKDAPFREFCANPTLQRSAKVTAISQALDKMKVTPQTKNMFVILTENGRLSRINTVLDKFDQLMSAHRGEVHCVVRTAKALDRSAENELRAALNEFLKPGEKLQLTMELDPALIGGMVVSIGDRLIDMSIARKVRTYREAMEQPL